MPGTLLEQLEESVKKVGGKVEPRTKEETKTPSELCKEAVQAFLEADQNYKRLEKCLLEGEFIPNTTVEGAHLKDSYLGLVHDVTEALEQRNVKLREAQDLLRQQVALEPTKQRGWNGKPSTLEEGPLSVSSVTNRWFDAGSLLQMAEKAGVKEDLLAATTLGKDGKSYHIVEQVWAVDYQSVLAWLTARKLDDVIKAAYDEKESTPQVKGAKPLAFLGDEVKK